MRRCAPRPQDVLVTHHAKIQRYPVAEHHGHLVHREVARSQKFTQRYREALAAGTVQRGDVVHDFPQPAGKTPRRVVLE